MNTQFYETIDLDKINLDLSKRVLDDYKKFLFKVL
jgi:hypothetical protein